MEVTKMAQKSCFITIEGIEGMGKSTAIRYLQKLLEAKKINYVATREPGGTPIAEAIRQVLLQHYAEKMEVVTELLLMFASRAQHIHTVIKPALQAERWVLCDRFTDASYAYQGGGRQIASDKIAVLENLVQSDLNPDIVILLDAPVSIGLERMARRYNKDRIEQEKVDFFQRVRDAYLVRAKQFPERYHIVNAAQSIHQVQKQLQVIFEMICKNYCQ
jgi:dTMP kinase